MLRFLHTISAALFTVLGLTLFGIEVVWQQNLWMPWSQVLLTTIPAPLIALGLLYGTCSIILSARDSSTLRTVIGTIVGAISITLFIAFALLRIWPLS